MPPKPSISAQLLRRSPSNLRTSASPFRSFHYATQSQRHLRPERLGLQRPVSLFFQTRHHSTAPSPPTAPQTTSEEEETTPRREFQLTFTCKPCETRSSHIVSHQGYYHGTVLITCPGCKNKHLICDHLKIFRDTSVTLEDLMREKGELVKRGNLQSDGDVEFWDTPTEPTETEQK